MGLYPAKKEGSPLTMKRRTSRWKEHATDLAFDLAGSFLMGVGVYTFALKGGFATGGLSGMALIDFVLPLFPVYEGSRLLAAGFSGVLMGAGLSLIYMRGSSTGGSDFLIHAAKRKAPHISFGNLSLAIDASVILLGIPAFGDIDAALYGMVSAFALTIVMDKIIYGAGSGKLVLVITNEGQAVSRAIDAAVERGSTLVDVTGSYSGLPRRMVMCACSNNEVFKVRTAAHRVDPRALVMICEASAVFGEGFRAPEVGEKTG